MGNALKKFTAEKVARAIFCDLAKRNYLLIWSIECTGINLHCHWRNSCLDAWMLRLTPYSMFQFTKYRCCVH